jgi:hypothetical protein
MNGWFTDALFPTDKAKCFPNDSAVRQSSRTPYFMDAWWPELWPKATDPPPRTYSSAAGMLKCRFAFSLAMLGLAPSRRRAMRTSSKRSRVLST